MGWRFKRIKVREAAAYLKIFTMPQIICFYYQLKK